MITKYGDEANIRTDRMIVNEIIGRQGLSLIIDVIVDQCENVSTKFKLDSNNRASLENNVIKELQSTFNERGLK